MAFVLIDGVICNDTFATGTTPGTSSLVDGINNQAFSTAQAATDQPVDAILGLTTWIEVITGAAGNLSWTSQNSTIAITEALSDSLTLGWASQSNTIAIATNLKNNDTLAWTSSNNVIALSGSLTNSGSLGWTSADNTILITANVASTSNDIALAWTGDNSIVALSGALTNNVSVGIQSQDDNVNIVAFSDTAVPTRIKGVLKGYKVQDREVRKTKEEIQQELWDLLFPVEHIEIVPTQKVKQIIDKISKRNYKSIMARNNAAVHETQRIIKKLQDEEDEELMFLL